MDRLLRCVEVSGDDEDGVRFAGEQIEYPLLQRLKKLPLPVVGVDVHVESVHLELLVHYLHENHLELLVECFWDDRREVTESQTPVNPSCYTTTTRWVVPTPVYVIVRRRCPQDLSRLLEEDEMRTKFPNYLICSPLQREYVPLQDAKSLVAERGACQRLPTEIRRGLFSPLVRGIGWFALVRQ